MTHWASKHESTSEGQTSASKIAMNSPKALWSERKQSTSYAPRNETREIMPNEPVTGKHMKSSEFKLSSWKGSSKVEIPKECIQVCNETFNSIQMRKMKIMLQGADIITYLIWVWMNMMSSKANAQYLLLKSRRDLGREKQWHQAKSILRMGL